MADRFAPGQVRMWWDPRQGMRSAVDLYQRMIGQPAAQLIGGGVRGFLGLDVPSYATDLGREAYRTGQAMGNMPGIGAPAGAFKAAAMGAQALPAVAGELGRMVSMVPTPRQAAALQAEDFLAYQRKIPVQDISPLTAYHGTPHTFPAEEGAELGRFRAEKIGSGEGNQAFGYGLYFAESPNVANTYRAGESISLNIKRAQWHLAKLAHKDPGPYPEAPQGGSVYTVDIPDAMVDKMMDWDKPLSQQPKAVQEALNKLPQDIKDYIGIGKYDDLKAGVDILNPLGGLIGDAKASELLRQVGIPGVRYLDQFSRGADGKGTRNLVVFPGEEQAVKILSRE
jgi:hypothetical protein